MKKITILFTSLLSFNYLFSQEDLQEKNNPFIEEGKRLYRSEMASWYGTDIFTAKFKDDNKKVKGYFSYPSGDSTTCVFYAKDEIPAVLMTIKFDSAFNTATASVDINERKFTNEENDLFTIRENAMATILSDSFFIKYKNTGINLVPIITNGEKRVYCFTGSQTNNVVYFGNDYLLSYDASNTLTEKKKLHNSLITVNYGEKDENGNVIVGAMHNHLTHLGEFMTATDICTIMLYEKIAKWKQYMVVSEHYMSIWDCETDSLVTITREAMDKIYGNDKKKKKKNKD